MPTFQAAARGLLFAPFAELPEPSNTYHGDRIDNLLRAVLVYAFAVALVGVLSRWAAAQGAPERFAVFQFGAARGQISADWTREYAPSGDLTARPKTGEFQLAVAVITVSLRGGPEPSPPSPLAFIRSLPFPETKSGTVRELSPDRAVAYRDYSTTDNGQLFLHRGWYLALSAPADTMYIVTATASERLAQADASFTASYIQAAEAAVFSIRISGIDTTESPVGVPPLSELRVRMRDMPTAEQLIANLRGLASAPDVQSATLIVAFEHETLYIGAGTSEAVTTLARALQRGGIPVGVAWLEAAGAKFRLRAELLHPWIKDSWAGAFMRKTLQEMLRMVGADSLPILEIPRATPPGWAPRRP